MMRSPYGTYSIVDSRTSLNAWNWGDWVPFAVNKQILSRWLQTLLIVVYICVTCWPSGTSQDFTFKLPDWLPKIGEVSVFTPSEKVNWNHWILSCPIPAAIFFRFIKGDLVVVHFEEFAGWWTSIEGPKPCQILDGMTSTLAGGGRPRSFPGGRQLMFKQYSSRAL